DRLEARPTPSPLDESLRAWPSPRAKISRDCCVACACSSRPSSISWPPRRRSRTSVSWPGGWCARPGRRPCTSLLLASHDTKGSLSRRRGDQVVDLPLLVLTEGHHRMTPVPDGPVGDDTFLVVVVAQGP